jgi:uncharacterized membrane protein
MKDWLLKVNRELLLIYVLAITSLCICCFLLYYYEVDPVGIIMTLTIWILSVMNATAHNLSDKNKE